MVYMNYSSAEVFSKWYFANVAGCSKSLLTDLKADNVKSTAMRFIRLHLFPLFCTSENWLLSSRDCLRKLGVVKSYCTWQRLFIQGMDRMTGFDSNVS